MPTRGGSETSLVTEVPSWRTRGAGTCRGSGVFRLTAECHGAPGHVLSDPGVPWPAGLPLTSAVHPQGNSTSSFQSTQMPTPRVEELHHLKDSDVQLMKVSDDDDDNNDGRHSVNLIER